MKQTICSYLDCERSCEADILKNTNYKVLKLSIECFKNVIVKLNLGEHCYIIIHLNTL